MRRGMLRGLMLLASITAGVACNQSGTTQPMDARADAGNGEAGNGEAGNGDARTDTPAGDAVVTGPVCEATGIARCLYVDPVSGSDTTGDGSIGRPFFKPQTAVVLAQPGDYVYLRGGTYDTAHAAPFAVRDWNDSSSTIYFATVSLGSDGLPGWALTQTQTQHYTVQTGTADHPITLKGYPGETAILHGEVRVTRSYWNVEGLILDGRNLPTSPSTISIQSDEMDAASPTHDVTIANNEIENFTSWTGNNPGFIRVDRGARAYNIHIRGNRIHDFQECGDDACTMIVPNSDHKIGAITTLSNQDYDGFDAVGTGAIEISGNTIYNVTNAFFFKNPMAGPIDITGNVIHDTNDLGFVAASNVTFRSNLVYAVSGGFNGLGANSPYTDPRMFTIAGNNLSVIGNTLVGMQELLTMPSSGTGHIVTQNVIFGLDQRVGGMNAGCCSDSAAYIKRTNDTAMDPAQSTLQTVMSDHNCFITPPPFADIEFVMRLVTATGMLEHYTQAQAGTAFHFDANSVFLGESDPTHVFANPAAGDYRLAAGSAAATQCAGMGMQ